MRKWMLLLILAGCGSENPPASSAEDAQVIADATPAVDASFVCMVDETRDCTCFDGSGGLQPCLADRSGFDSCTCGPTDSGVEPDAGQSDATSMDTGIHPRDGSAPDMGSPDSGIIQDSGALVDSGVPADSGVAPDSGVDPCLSMNCDDGNPCTADSCSAGVCQHQATSEGASCGSGICRAGSCCNGCWDGSACQPGNAVAACGTPQTGGGMCSSCDDSNACTSDSCSNGICSHPAVAPGTMCPGGTCSAIGTCLACGSQGENCCFSGGASYCDTGLFCEGNNTCQSSCGNLNEACCGTSCNGVGVLSCRSGFCQPLGCGFHGNACCPLAPRCNTGMTCAGSPAICG